MSLQPEDKELFKATAKDILPSMYLMVSALVISFVFSPPASWFIFIMVTIALWFDVVATWRGKATREPKRVFMMAGTILGFLYAVAFVQHYAGRLGVLSFLAVPVAIAIYYIIRRWSLFMSWIRHIEKRFTGMTAEERLELKRARRKEA